MVGRNPSAEPATPCHRGAAAEATSANLQPVRNANTLAATVFTGAVVLGLAGASAPAGEALNPGHLLYDEALRRLIMLAAYPPPELPELAELREWRTTGWTLLPATSDPSMRTLSAAVYDSRRKRIVMHEGLGNRRLQDPRGDTWEFDGRRWVQMPDPSIAAPVWCSCGAARPAARTSTTCGGGTAHGRQKSVPGNRGRQSASGRRWCMTSRAVIVLYGGRIRVDGAVRTSDEIWEWHRLRWTHVLVAR